MILCSRVSFSVLGHWLGTYLDGHQSYVTHIHNMGAMSHTFFFFLEKAHELYIWSINNKNKYLFIIIIIISWLKKIRIKVFLILRHGLSTQHGAHELYIRNMKFVHCTCPLVCWILVLILRLKHKKVLNSFD